MLWILISVIVIIIGLLLYWWLPAKMWSNFFGEKKKVSLANYIKYLATICGGFIIVGTLYETSKSNRLALEANVINEKVSLDSRYIEANNLLSNNDLSAQTAGAYALHRIAMDASKYNSQKGYVRGIKDILCVLISEKSKLEANKQIALFQNIIDNLFREETWKIYEEHPVYLQGSVLKGCDLAMAHLEGANLAETHLEGISLDSAFLENANLEQAHLEGAHLCKARLESVNLKWANLKETDLGNVHLEKANLEGANLEGAFTMKQEECYKAILEFAEKKNLQMVTTTPVYLLLYDNNSNSKIAYLDDVSFRRTILEYSNLERTYLEGANLFYANLKGARLWRANLQEANLEYADLESASLNEGNLEKTVLKNANLKGTDLSNANLEFTDFSEAIIDDKTIFLGTIHEGKTIEEIKKYKPLEKKSK